MQFLLFVVFFIVDVGDEMGIQDLLVLFGVFVVGDIFEE